MSLKVSFNGRTLVRPGAASRVISRLQSYGISGTGNLGLVGYADGGAQGIHRFTNPEAMKAYFVSGPLADAAEAAFRPSNDPRIPGGAQEVFAYNLGPNTQATLTGGIVTNTPAQLLTVTSKLYGAPGNKISVKYTAATRIIEASMSDGVRSVTETSTGASADRISIRYVGGGEATSATVAFTTETAGTLTTSVTGNAGNNLNIDLSLFATLGDVVNAIKGFGAGNVYTASLVGGTNPNLPSNCLDRITVADITSAAGTLTSIAYDLITWSEASQLVAVTRTGATVTGIPVDKTKSLLTGGVKGADQAVATWTTGFNALKAYRIHACVPMLSTDDGTCTVTDMVAAAVSYATAMNSAAGKNEVQLYVGMSGSKSTVTSFVANSLNDANAILCCQKHTLRGADGALKVFPEWSSAILYAAMRCGAPLGEPITYKYARSYGVTQDATIILPDHIDEMLSAGVSLWEAVPGKGIRLVKGNTTYTKTDDDAFTEESVVSVWKTVSYELRSYLEDRFTGTKGTPATVGAIADETGAKLEQFRTAEALVDSQDDDGNPLHAWRDVAVTLDRDTATVSATITPVEGVNYTLATIYLAPVRLSA